MWRTSAGNPFLGSVGCLKPEIIERAFVGIVLCAAQFQRSATGESKRVNESDKANTSVQRSAVAALKGRRGRPAKTDTGDALSIGGCIDVYRGASDGGCPRALTRDSYQRATSAKKRVGIVRRYRQTPGQRSPCPRQIRARVEACKC